MGCAHEHAWKIERSAFLCAHSLQSETQDGGSAQPPPVHKRTHTFVPAVTHAHLGGHSRHTPFLGRRLDSCDIEPSDESPPLKMCHVVIH